MCWGGQGGVVVVWRERGGGGEGHDAQYVGRGLVIRELYDYTNNLLLCVVTAILITARLKCGYHIIEEELSM